MKKDELKNIYAFLRESDQIKENHVIDSDILKNLFGENDVKSLDYVFPLIELKGAIEKNGLACQIKNGNLVIFDVNQNHQIGAKRIKKSFRIQDKTGNMLLNTDLDKIDDQRDKKEHIHMINIYLFLKKGRVSLDGKE